jgi:serine protease Do
MRKALVTAVAVVALAAVAFTFAPSVWSQTKPSIERPSAEKRDRRVMMLDGRGSSIGVSVRDLDADETAKAKLGQSGGVMIEEVDENSPAAKAGLRDGDVIVEFDGERVRSARHFARLVQETAEGRTVKATVIREGSRQTVDVTPSRGGARWSGDLIELPRMAEDIQREVERGMRALPRDFAFDFHWDGEFPDATVWPRGRFGARLSPLTDQLAEYFGAKDGVLVASVTAESVAAKAGLKAGDVITAVNGRTVETPREVVQELRDAESGKDVEIAVLRDRKPLTLKAQMPERRRPDVRRSVRPV